MREESEIKRKLDEKIILLKNITESLSSDLTDTDIDCHPAVIAQWHYIEALKWILEVD